MDKTTDPWAKWEPCPDTQAQAALARITAEVPTFFRGATLKQARCSPLPFYQRHTLLDLQLEFEGKSERAFLLDGNGLTWWLNGDSQPIHAVNLAESLELTSDTVRDYLRFFLYFLRGGEGAFALAESPEEITATGHDDTWFEQYTNEPNLAVAQLWFRLQDARKNVAPLEITGTDDEEHFLLAASIIYENARYGAVFAVEPGGKAVMVQDNPLMTMDGLSGPAYPTLTLSRKVEEPEEAPRQAPKSRVPTAAQIRRMLARESLVSADAAGLDRKVTQAVVATLLEEAIRGREGNQLIQPFNSETAADKPIERLANLVRASVPVVVIESDIPFVEEFVLGLLRQADPELAKGPVTRATVISGDESRCELRLSGDDVRGVYLLSFHAYRSLVDAEWNAHVLAIGDAAVLIGADRHGDVPEPLRRVTDIVLKFPRIDRRVFERIFERVFESEPAPGWEGAAADWTRYLVPADFHAPRRLGLDPDRALAYLKERVANRLKLVSAESGPSLDDLHGLGEARQVAEDLIADIRAAQAGRIPWTAVDRGLLLAGRPGTGKTTLARAIAKECGIKFLVSSAANWQSMGALDAHLRAIRADFSEARRFAPSILFIDEIDSIGSRELLSGQNMVYQTEVINALLEQVQGFDASTPVIVMGATNFVEKVDPALRRAGRLDQVVYIPLPNIASLEYIFRYYLKSYRSANEVGADVDERQLAELAFGLTGADVEFFVRGASRRARRDGRPIGQVDLLAEVTRRPRRADSAPRLDPDDLRRVAVHEAGHAVATLLGARKGAELTFVTIVPRMDGSLGFVASVPRESAVLTRRTMLERLEVVLAGRASEEIVYGAADVGLGAGGPSESSDLAVATNMATMLVCQTGLGADEALHWTEAPTPAQQAQINALLRKAYSSIVARLEANRGLLDEVARLLVERQEISGAEMRSLTAAMRGVAPVPVAMSSGEVVV